MSDLIRRIHEAQVQAGEDVVVEDLRRKGLLPPKTAIVINLDELGDLMQTYVAENIAEDERILESIRFSTFLAWLARERRETTTNEPTQRTTNLQLAPSTNR